MTLLTEDQQKAERLRSLARTFAIANTTIVGRPITVDVIAAPGIPAPGYSQGDAIYLNLSYIGSTDTTDDIIKITGLDFHELAHAEYTPREGTWIVGQIKAHGLWPYFNILEDQRIESLLVAKYGALSPYFVMTVMRYIAGPKGDLDSAHALTYGRRYLPRKVRDALGQRFKHQSIRKQMEAVIDEYRTIVYPRDDRRGFDLTAEFANLLKSQMGLQLPPDPHGHDTNKRPPSPGGHQPQQEEAQQEAQKERAKSDKKDDDGDEFLPPEWSDDDTDDDTDDQQQSGSGKSDDDESDDDASDDADGEGAGDGDESDDDLSGSGSESDDDDDADDEEGAGNGSDGEGDDDSDTDSDADGEGSSSDTDGGDSDSDADDSDVDTDAAGKGDPDSDVKPSREVEDDDDLRDLLGDVARHASNRDDVQRDAKVKREAIKRINGDIPTLDLLDYKNKAPRVDYMQASTRFKRELTKLWVDADPGWTQYRASGRVNVQRAMRGGEIDTLFDQWDEGKQDATSIELVVLFDYSYSMARQMENASQALWAVKRAVESIGGDVTVIGFSDDAVLMYDKTHKASAQQYRHFGPGGGTDPYAALQQARLILHYSKKVHKIVLFMTDGSWDLHYPMPGERQDYTHESEIQQLHAHGIQTALAYLGRSSAANIATLDEDDRIAYFHGCQSWAYIHDPKGLVTLAQGIVKRAMSRS